MVKTLQSNLVTVLKKAMCTAGTLRAEAHTAPARVAVVDTIAPGLVPILSQVRAEPYCSGSTAGLSGSLLEPKSEKEGWTGQTAGRAHQRLVSNKKENSSLYTVVCFGSVQTE